MDQVREPRPAHVRQAHSEAQAAFLSASIAVWREIDRLDSQPEGYHPIRMSVELRKAERAAWERLRGFLDGKVPP
jgi:hypothetical protein